MPRKHKTNAETVADLNGLVARSMRESELQENVRQLAKLRGWLYYHTHRAEHSPSGFPDCFMIRKNRIVVAELKRQDKELTDAQEEWLDAFRAFDDINNGSLATVESYRWHPSHWLDGTIERVLS